MHAQVNDEGHQHQMLSEIQDHRKDDTAMPKEQGKIATNGIKKDEITMKGWAPQVLWKDGSTTWIKLNELKESNPMEVAEHAVANRIQDEPTFAWWASKVLRQRNRMMSKVKKKHWRTTHEFGIRLPKSTEEALRLDAENGDDHLKKALDKEMTKAKASWERPDNVTPEQARTGKVSELIGHQEIDCHVVFDMRMDFAWKCCFCAGGHATEAPSSIAHLSMVSHGSARIGFLTASLHGVDITAIDIENAHLNAPHAEKIWFEGDMECGEDKGFALVLQCSSHGLKSSGFAWRSALASALRDIGFKDSLADPNVWLRAATWSEGHKHCGMLFVCTDDILIVSHLGDAVAEEIDDFCKVKPGSEGEPKTFLGADCEKIQLADRREIWTTSSKTCIANAIETVQALLDKDGEDEALKPRAKNPFPSGCKPELNVSRELGPELLSRHLQLIGMLRWGIELGGIDVFHEVALSSQHQANPRVGHLEAAYHMFAYVKNHMRMGWIGCNPIAPKVDLSVFNDGADWREFHGDVKEEMPPRMPEPCGNGVSAHAFVDANHAGNVIMRRSHTCVFLFTNNVPIIWFSKRQNTVEASTFGSELVALRICKDLIVALRHELRMFGIRVEGPAHAFCDNRGVVKNMSIPKSVLHKKHNSINHHSVREAVAAEITKVGKEDGDTNLSDLFTKVVMGQK